MKKLTLLFALALPLLAEDPKPACDATDWKARAEWLGEKLAATEGKMAAMAQFYSVNEQLTALAAKEPPKPALRSEVPICAGGSNPKTENCRPASDIMKK